MASYSRGSRGGSDIARRVSQLESRIENIDKHIMLSFNIIKNDAQNMAHIEGLQAHKLSVRIRQKK